MMEKQTPLHNALKQIGLRCSFESFNALIEQLTAKKCPPTEVCERLFHLEQSERDILNHASRLKAAHLGKFKLIDQFDWNFPKHINSNLYHHLIILDFINHTENVLFRGPSGVGKTMLAKNLGLLAIQKGYTVRFTSLSAALVDISRQESLPAMERRFKHYTHPTLLIIDEIGFVPCDNRSADILFNIISRRHENHSTIITTNLAFKQWGTIFPGAACITAMVDRFMQQCHVMDIEGDSWREKEAKEFSKKPVKPKNAISKTKSK